MIKIMADSTCDLSKEVVDRFNIGIAPLNVIIDGKSYRDGVDMTADEFYILLDKLEEHPTTSMPSPEAYLNVINSAVEEGHDEILCICMSSGTSGSYQSAVLAKEIYFEDNPGSRIILEVIDSTSMSQGSGWLIMKAAKMREDGKNLEEILDFIEKYKTNVKHFLCVDDLENLIKSGRLTNASAFIGKLLRIKPIMSMRNGKGAIVGKERGLKKVLSHYVSEFVRRIHWELTDFIIIGYTTKIEIAQELKAKILEETDYNGEIYIMQMGAAVGTHVGSGGISMFFLEKGKISDGLIKNEVRHLKEKKDEIIENIIH